MARRGWGNDMTRSIPGARITRAEYDEVSLYAPNRAVARIDLSDNTNLWGMPPGAAREVHRAASASITRYPPLYADELKQAIAAYLGGGVTPDMIVTGCGSDDVLDSAIRALGPPGTIVAHLQPSFAMIPRFARVNGLEPRPIMMTSEFDADADAFIAARPRIAYLCSPNNPTGAPLSRTSIERVIRGVPGVTIVDEAYAEFAAENMLDLLATSPRLLISRTMSKAFGLAGLRIGYAVGDPAVVAAVEKSRGPYKVSAIAARAAVAALTEDLDWVRERVALAVENRERLVRALRLGGYAPVASAANFVLVPVSDATGADRALRDRGIAVRPFAGLAGIGDALRVSVGPWDMLEECVSALTALAAPGEAGSA